MTDITVTETEYVTPAFPKLMKKTDNGNLYFFVRSDLPGVRVDTTVNPISQPQADAADCEDFDGTVVIDGAFEQVD